MGLFSKKQADIPRRRLVDSNIQQSNSSDIFRRNRTLTGTTSNNFGSVDIDRSHLESTRSHIHNLAQNRRKVLSLLVVAITASILLWVMISNFTASVTITLLDTSISKPVDKARYQKVIQQYLDSNPIARFHFFLDESNLAAYLSDNLPEVSAVSQRGMLSIGETEFVLTMRKPVAGWEANNTQYYVDSSGISFEYNYFSSSVVQIVDNSGISAQTGAAVVSTRFLSFVGRLVAAAKSSGYTVVQAMLTPNTTRELDIKLSNSDILIKLSIDRPAGEQVEDMANALRYLNNKGMNPSYVDVRVSGKAFYK